MKKLLLLLLFPLALHAQPRIVGMGEYQSLLLNPNDHQVYTMRTGIQVKLAGQPANIVNIFGGLHIHYLVDASANCYAYDENAGTFTLVDKNVAKVSPSSNTSIGPAIIHTDGTLWLNGAQVSFPAGTAPIVDVWLCANGLTYAQDSAGGVYSWGFSGYGANWGLMQGTDNPNSTTPTKIPLPGPVKSMCAHNWAAHFLLRNGQLYAGGMDFRYYGYNLGQIPASNAPMRADLYYKFLAPIAQISANYTTTFARLTDGTLWGWGENTSGTVGNGQETNIAADNYYAPWYNSTAWNLPSGQGGALFQLLPAQIGIGTNWADLKRGICFAMYMLAEDVNGALYSWGRWKGLVLWNGVTGTDAQYNNQANQPNLFDVLSPTKIIDLPNIATVPPPNKPPVAVLTGPASVTLPSDTIRLDASGSTDSGGSIATYTIAQISGPPGVLVQSGAKATAYATAAGTYTFRATVTDNTGLSTSTTLAVVVKPYPPCPMCPPPVVCPVCPAPRNVTSVTFNVFGTTVTVPSSAIVSATYQ